jgi:hypothetical protein
MDASVEVPTTEPVSEPAPAPAPAPDTETEPAPETEAETTDVSGGLFPIPSEPTPPPVLRIQDILASVEVLQGNERNDKSVLEGIATLSFDAVRPRLVQWATSGFRNAYVIHEIPMVAPPLCSDGESRTLTDYVSYVSGKTIQEHVAGLQARLPDITVSFAYSGSSILIVVSKSD